MLVLGLTGNIGCGKSSVSTIFMNHGIDIVDADIVARYIFEDLDLLNKVFSTFGETIKNEDGSLNRKALGNIVFNDDEKLIALNNLTHPKIKENILKKIEEYNKNIDIGKTYKIQIKAYKTNGAISEIEVKENEMKTNLIEENAQE